MLTCSRCHVKIPKGKPYVGLHGKVVCVTCYGPARIKNIQVRVPAHVSKLKNPNFQQNVEVQVGYGGATVGIKSGEKEQKKLRKELKKKKGSKFEQNVEFEAGAKGMGVKFKASESEQKMWRKSGKEDVKGMKKALKRKKNPFMLTEQNPPKCSRCGWPQRDHEFAVYKGYIQPHKFVGSMEQNPMGATESHGFCAWCGIELPPYKEWPYVLCKNCDVKEEMGELEEIGESGKYKSSRKYGPQEQNPTKFVPGDTAVRIRRLSELACEYHIPIQKHELFIRYVLRRFEHQGWDPAYWSTWARRFRDNEEWQYSDKEGRKVLLALAPAAYEDMLAGFPITAEQNPSKYIKCWNCLTRIKLKRNQNRVVCPKCESMNDLDLEQNPMSAEQNPGYKFYCQSCGNYITAPTRKELSKKMDFVSGAGYLCISCADNWFKQNPMSAEQKQKFIRTAIGLPEMVGAAQSGREENPRTPEYQIMWDVWDKDDRKETLVDAGFNFKYARCDWSSLPVNVQSKLKNILISHLRSGHEQNPIPSAEGMIIEEESGGRKYSEIGDELSKHGRATHDNASKQAGKEFHKMAGDEFGHAAKIQKMQESGVIMENNEDENDNEW